MCRLHSLEVCFRSSRQSSGRGPQRRKGNPKDWVETMRAKPPLAKSSCTCNVCSACGHKGALCDRWGGANAEVRTVPLQGSWKNMEPCSGHFGGHRILWGKLAQGECDLAGCILIFTSLHASAVLWVIFLSQWKVILCFITQLFNCFSVRIFD